MASAPSSYIPTGAAVDTRTRDQLSFPFLARPQAMTIYLRFVEIAAVANTAVRGVIFIGSSLGGSASFDLNWAGSQYRVTHGPSPFVEASLGVAPTIGQMVELRAVLNSDGSVVIGQAINGAIETTASNATTKTLAQNWGAASVRFNDRGAGGSNGFTAFRNLVIVAGVKTMDQMRQLAGTDT